MNVSSIVIKTRPEHLQTVLGGLRSIKQCDVHFHDEQGRIIVTIEGADTESELATLKMIQKVPHVVSAELVFAYSEHELAEAFRKIESAREAVPERLRE